MRGFNHWFTSVAPFRLACRTRAVWQCRPVPSLSGLLATLPCASRVRLPSASPDCCDRPEAGSFHPARLHGASWRTPEIRYTKEGQATAQLGIAVNRRWQDRTTQEWQEATSFFDVVCWRDLAENVALSLSKGMRVIVTGRLEQRSWETEEGDHRSKVEITADEIGPSLLFATADVQRTARRQEVSEPESEVPS